MSSKQSLLTVKQRDLMVGGVFLGVAIGFYIYSYFMSGVEIQATPHDVGPTFMPRLVLGALAVEAIVLMILALKKKGVAAESLKPILQKRPIIMLAVFLVYLYAANLIGYIPSSIIFMIVGFLLLGVRNIWSLVLIPPLYTMGTYYLFGKLLNIYLPGGSLF